MMQDPCLLCRLCSATGLYQLALLDTSLCMCWQVLWDTNLCVAQLPDLLLARLQLLGAPAHDVGAEAPRHERYADGCQQHVKAHSDAQGGLNRQVAPAHAPLT